MKIRVLSHADVVKSLCMSECISLMKAVFSDYARGRVFQPLRVPVSPPAIPGLLGLMPACIDGDIPVLGLKAVCVFPTNSTIGKDPHQGVMMLFDSNCGELRAVINASALTGIRTAAATAVATDCLARPDASRLAIIGCGHQAMPHIEAMLAVRAVEHVRVVASRVRNAERFAIRCAEAIGVSVEAFALAEDAVREADMIVTVTSSNKPVIRGDWLTEGTHVNLVGACRSDSREADSKLIARATFFTDSRESCLNESGDYLIPFREGVISEAHIQAELGEVLIGANPGRQDNQEITVFNSLGLAAQDVAAAEHAAQTAHKRGLGTLVDY